MRPDVLIRSVAEHVGSYVELGSMAAAEYRDVWLRRLLLAVIVTLAGVTGLVLAWVAGLIAVWDTGWRLAYVVISAVLLFATAGVALYRLRKRTPDGPSVTVLRSELIKDRELFEQWKHRQ